MPVVVVIRLDDRGHESLDADAVRAHHHRDFLPLFVQDAELHRFRVAEPELEDVTELDGLPELERTSALRTGVSRDDVPEARPLHLREIARDVHVSHVEVVLVGAGHDARGDPSARRPRRPGRRSRRRRRGSRAERRGLCGIPPVSPDERSSCRRPPRSWFR